MIENNNLKEIKKTKKIFATIYWTLVSLGFTFLLLDRFFAENNKSDNTFMYLTIACLMLAFIAMFANNVKLEYSKTQLVMSALCFLPNTIFAFLYLFLPLNITMGLIFSFNLFFGLVALILYMRYKTNHPEPQNDIYDHKITMVVLASIALALIISLRRTYFDSNILYKAGGIVGAIAFLIYAILTLTVFRKIYTNWLIKKSARFTAFVGAAMLSFAAAIPLVDVINTTGQTPASQNEYVVIAKEVVPGAKGSKSYYLYMEIDNKTVKINVNSHIYKTKSTNDKLKINIYNGNLHWKYYTCADWGD